MAVRLGDRGWGLNITCHVMSWQKQKICMVTEKVGDKSDFQVWLAGQ